MDEEDHTFTYKVGQVDEVPTSGLKERGLMVNTGSTSHIVTDAAKSKTLDTCFKLQNHVWELADGKRNSGISLKKGSAEVRLIDNRGHEVDVKLT